MPDTPEINEGRAPARRTVLRGAAVAAAAGVPLLAMPTTADARESKPKGKPVADVKDIPVGGGKYFEKETLIVTQPTKGTFKGFNATCTHSNCPITNFETKGQMICECHNGVFSIDDGKVIKGPARRPMNPEKIVVEKGKIYKDG